MTKTTHTTTSPRRHNLFQLLQENKTATLVAVALLIAVAALSLFSRGDITAGIDFTIAQRQDVVSEVSVTGRVEPAESVDLGFERSGKVSAVAIDVGDRVFRGLVLIRLLNNDEQAALARAEAGVKVEAAKLDELLRGSTPEAIAVKEVKAANAAVAVIEEKRNLIAVLQDAFTKADDAVRNKIDQFISGPETTNPEITFLVNDPQLETIIEGGRRDMSEILNAWTVSVNTLSLASDLSLDVMYGKDNLDAVKRFLDNVSIAVNAVKANSNLSQATIDSYRADTGTARTNVNTALSNIIAAEKKVRDAQSALLLAEEELAEIKAGTRPEAIAAQEAKVEESRATVLEKEALLQKTVLVSPIAGIVTVADVRVGEIVPANTTLVSVISEDDFEIEVNVPEADIAKVSLGDPARVTLDAYGSDVFFTTRVMSVDPAETVIEGVPTYQTTLHFNEPDARIRSGMTANIDILADRRDGVIAIPARAVITRDGDRVVRVLNERDEVVEVPVETGLRGSDGMIEIISGIEEGDRVIVFIEAERLLELSQKPTRSHSVEQATGHFLP